jgi:hypothetical protein
MQAAIGQLDPSQAPNPNVTYHNPATHEENQAQIA